MTKLGAALSLLSVAVCAAPVVGVGLSVKIVDDRPVIDALIPGGPAAVEGHLQEGDIIEAVAQGAGPWKDTKGLTLEQFVALVRGARGTKVRLRAVREGDDGKTKNVLVTLTRDVLKETAAP
jgi:carboxyl-terminal processing protease